MRNIKIIKRKTVESGEPTTAAAQPQKSDAAQQRRRDATAAISGWISDWRGRKQPNPRVAFDELFKPSAA